MRKVKTLHELNNELNNLYFGIDNSCRNCKEEDCKGYVWLLDEEVKKILNNGVNIIEINKNIDFIDSFSRNGTKIRTDVVRPPCVLRNNNRKCLVYKDRPLICRLYPLDFKIFRNRFYIILHTDCLFVQKLTKNGNISAFIDKIVSLFYNINKSLLINISLKYKQVDYICRYNDYKHDDYKKILWADLNFNKLKLCQSAKQFLTQKK